MNIILLISIIQVVFISIFLISKKEKNISDFIFILWLFITSFPLVIYFLNYNEYFLILKKAKEYPSWLMFINLPFFLLHTPFIYIYVSSVIKQKLKFLHFLYFVPLIFFLLLSYFYYHFDKLDKINFSILAIKYPFILLSFFPLVLILTTLSIYNSLKLINRYSKHIKNNYSKSDMIDITWIKTIVYINIVFWISFLIIIIMQNINNYDNLYKIPFILVLIFIFFLSFMGFKRPNIFIKYDENITKKYNEDTTKLSVYTSKVLEYVEKEKPYLNSNLTITELAKQLDMLTYQLSKIINNEIGKTFFDFINSYRVEEVKKMMKKNKNYKIIAIAYDCGFNSKSSFNRIFKKITGKTPSQYRKEIENSNLS